MGLAMILLGIGVFAVERAGRRKRRGRRARCRAALHVGKSFQQVHRARIYPHRDRARVDRMQRSMGRRLPKEPSAYCPTGRYPDLEAHQLAIRGTLR